MNIHDLLTNFQKTRNFKYYVGFFCQNPTEIKQLVDVIVKEEPYPFSEYSSWLLTHIVKVDCALIEPYRNQVVDVVLKNQNQSALRNCVNVLQFLKGSNYKEAELMDRFIFFIKEGENKVALQVYSMYCLVSYVEKYPELKSEFISIIQLFVVERSAAYKGGVKNFFKMTKKIV